MPSFSMARASRARISAAVKTAAPYLPFEEASRSADWARKSASTAV